MTVFFIFAMLLGAALQITNTFGGSFLDSFSMDAMYKSSFAVTHPNLLMSVSQISETLFILTIPFFLSRFGIKKVMMMSMFAWVFRFGLFGIGNPGHGLILLVLSMIIYGMAFDFFNISGSLFVEQEVAPNIRASAQGLFMIMTNGLGAIIGGFASGKIVDIFTTYNPTTHEVLTRNWHDIWMVFAAYALVLALVFPLVFKYKHDRNAVANIHH
jgi:NHS family xanthosine MFS transporter